jgi:hypothetical protein
MKSKQISHQEKQKRGAPRWNAAFLLGKVQRLAEYSGQAAPKNHHQTE